MFNWLLGKTPTMQESNMDLSAIKNEHNPYEEKRKQALEKLGTKWILHPSNKIVKRDIQPNFLGK